PAAAPDLRPNGRLMRTGWHRLVLLVAWVATRSFFAAIVLRWIYLHGLRSANGDVKIYRGWSKVLAHGHFPVHDPQWQYPPLAGPLLLAPKLIANGTGMTYFRAFLLMAILADGII